MIRNLILDWSGTLVDDLPAVWRTTNHVLRESGAAELTLETFREEFELPFTRFYDRFVPHAPTERLEELFHGFFPGTMDLVEELPHARDFLEYCRGAGLRTVLFSAIPESQYDFLTRRNGFHVYWEHAELGVRDKREGIAGLLETHGFVPGETMFVGDMAHDMEAAHAGGVHACATLTGYNNLAQLRRSRPHLIVENLSELREHFERGTLARELTGRETGRLPVATVGGLIFNRRGEVLLVRTHKWSNLWGMPGGKIKYGESSPDAFAREALEETGLKVRDIEFVMAQDCVRPEQFYRDAHFVLLNYVCALDGAAEVRLNDEAREHVWIPLEKSLDLPLNGPSEKLIRAAIERGRNP